MPADWGIDQRLVWQVTIRDETYRAEAWLQPEWEIFDDPFSRFFASAEGAAENQAPTLSTIEVPSAIRAGEAVDAVRPRQRRRSPGAPGTGIWPGAATDVPAGGGTDPAGERAPAPGLRPQASHPGRR